MKLSELWDALKQVLSGIAGGIADRSVEVIEDELKEMEGTFALLLLGSFLGLPSPPSFVGLSLLPYLERELVIALSRSRFIDDAPAFWFELADI